MGETAVSEFVSSPAMASCSATFLRISSITPSCLHSSEEPRLDTRKLIVCLFFRNMANDLRLVNFEGCGSDGSPPLEPD